MMGLMNDGDMNLVNITEMYFFTGNECCSCKCWCRFLFGNQYSYDRK